METNVTTETIKLASAYPAAATKCIHTYHTKRKKYGNSLEYLRPSTLLDILRNKSNHILRLLSLEVSTDRNDELIGEFVAVVNYSVELMDNEDKLGVIVELAKLEQIRSEQYGQGWKSMRITSFADLIAAKIQRCNQMIATRDEDYKLELPDIANYALFAIARLTVQSGMIVANDAENNNDGSVCTNTCSLSGIVQDDNTVC